MFAKMALCAAVALAGPGSNAEQVSVDQGFELLPIEQNVIDGTNAERARRGLTALEVDAELMKSARLHAAWMTNHRSLVHTSRPVAENIAMGYSNSRAVVAGWTPEISNRLAEFFCRRSIALEMRSGPPVNTTMPSPVAFFCHSIDADFCQNPTKPPATTIRAHKAINTPRSPRR